MEFKDLSKEQKGWFISGFAAGESYFLVRPLFRKTKKGFSRVIWQFRWGIQLRDDDQKILDDIKDFFIQRGCKTLTCTRKKRKNLASGNYTVCAEGYKNGVFIREFFNEFPLITKKQTDFITWSTVLDELLTINSESLEIKDREYTQAEIERRLYICFLSDQLRIGRVNSSMLDLGVLNLIQGSPGQHKLHVMRFLQFLLSNSVLTKSEVANMYNKFRVKI